MDSLGLSEKEESETAEVVLKDKEFAQATEGSIEYGSNNNTIFRRSQVSKESRYDVSLARVKQYVPAINKVLRSYAQEYKYVLRGMRSGLLDTNKLSEAYQGVPTVYLREGEVRVDKVCVCLLIDESGSMGGGVKIEAARDTGVLINEAIGNVSNVDLFIYGHTADRHRRGATELMIYREHGFAPRKALGDCEAQWENRDGTAIYEAAKRVRKQTYQPVLMFVISDGQPAADGYHGSGAIHHTKQMVERVENMGFSVVQICIEPSYDPALMFKHFVILKDMSTLALDLSKVIKTALLKHTKKVSVSHG
jgi:nitric oxide reductase activation protein